jgi:hypothetical protein
VARAILSASRATGVPARYLWRTAQRESGLDPLAASNSSTARGLFQFVESTWLEVVQSHGARHGLPAEVWSRPDGRELVLRLRFDPWFSARMAAELTRQNSRLLSTSLGRRPTEGEAYVAHFLGAADAARLIRAAALTPDRPASSLLPAAARANPAVFYRSGRALSCGKLLERLSHG